jgi:hypothetical protein
MERKRSKCSRIGLYLISSGTAKRSACILLGINEKRKVRM